MAGGHVQHVYGPMDQSLLHNAESVPLQDGVGDRLYMEEGTSSTPSARIMCPGLMVRVTIREAPGSTNRSDFYNLIGHSNDYAVVVCRIGTQSSRWIPRR